MRKPTGHIEDHPWCKFEREVKVKSVRLDTFCEGKNIKNIDFIWMDVQGAEDLVFEGACKILKSTHHIYTEYSNKELYESQPTLKRILDRLKDFVVLESFVDGDRGDVLLRNTNYERA